jgi:ribosomal protein L24E
MRISLTMALAAAAVLTAAAGAEPKKSAKEGLQQLHDLIGAWKCTGNPLVGTREEKEKFWQEKVVWQWKFDGKDVHIVGDVEKGKHFSKFALRYLPEKDAYELTATRQDKSEATFAGSLEKKNLTLERTDEKTKKGERLLFMMHHNNRHVVYYEEKPAEAKSYTRLYRLGCTNEAQPFATVDKGPECIVSGGLGTMAVSHKGKTYYVCCSGCRDAFKDDPDKYVKEFEEAQKKNKK